MGQVYADIEIINPFHLEKAKRHEMDMDEVKRMHINVLVDTGANWLCINENIQAILELPFVKKERFVLADGKAEVYDKVGPVEIRFKDHVSGCYAIVLPGDSEPLLGVIPMEDMDISIHPIRHELVVNTRLPISGFRPMRGRLIYT